MPAFSKDGMTAADAQRRAEEALARAERTAAELDGMWRVVDLLGTALLLLLVAAAVVGLVIWL